MRKEQNYRALKKRGEMTQRRTRVLMTTMGLDAHDRGLRVVASALKNGGIEVIYTGHYQTPEQVSEIALQEGVDAIGVSSLSYDHVLVPALMKSLGDKGLDDVLVILGGIIPDEDGKVLKKMGVAEIFPPGSKLDEIVAFFKDAMTCKRKRSEGE